MRSLGTIIYLLLFCFTVAACDAEVIDTEIPPFIPCEEYPSFDTDMEQVIAGDFYLRDELVFPHGVNSYPLLEHIGYGNDALVEDVFLQAQSLGRTFVRTNAFLEARDNPAVIRDATGAIQEAGLVALDRLLQLAQQNQVKLLLVLSNNWSDYGGAPYVVETFAPGESLPKDAFWSDSRFIAAQSEYLTTLATRVNTFTGAQYSDDPHIFAWELINEARCTDDHYCTKDTLADWALQMSMTLRQAGVKQLISWGGAGFDDKYGENLHRIGQNGGVDILTLHLYPHLASPGILDASREQRIETASALGAARIRDAVAIAREVELPLLLEEYGWPVYDEPGDDAERAQVLANWLAVAHDEGIATYAWMIAESDRTNYDTHLIRPTEVATWGVLTCSE